jgi:phage shock protein PspC (stress-responsive transcriptional regulator)
MAFGGIILYVLAWIIIPASSTVESKPVDSRTMTSALVGFVLVGAGILLLLFMILPWRFMHPWNWHWHYCWPMVSLRFIWPFVLVILGIVLLAVGLSGRSSREISGDISSQGPPEPPISPSETEREKPITRRLFRSSRNRKIAGICGGLGDYFDLDPTVFRVLWIILLIFFGTGILLYLILWIVIPREPESFHSTTS